TNEIKGLALYWETSGSQPLVLSDAAASKYPMWRPDAFPERRSGVARLVFQVDARAIGGHPERRRREELVEGLGDTDEFALNVPDAEFDEAIEDCPVMDMLGHGPDIEPVRDPHGRHHDLFIDGAVGEVADEGAVDLQVVERKALEVFE